MLTDRQLKKAEKHLTDLLHWTWSCQLQLRRYLESLGAEWSGTEPPALERRRIFSSTSYDEHALLLAARNLLRELDRSGKSLPTLALPENTKRTIKCLRDSYEHFAELTASTREELQSLGASPRMVQFSAEGPVIGGAFKLGEFNASLDQLEVDLLEFERAVAEQDAREQVRHDA